GLGGRDLPWRAQRRPRGGAGGALVHETAEDLAALQRLLDDSHARAGRHLRSIFDDERRIPALDLPALLGGVQVLNLATVTKAGEPRLAPVDGLVYRARFRLGPARDSARL